ncbi:blr4931 [Bradyrhizobium diazoefficiens USDA 110]|uniref:Blr4931 protein n=1 Tax=Bradyrhizobium diazoefficiens (strain JCM 10833 / BCRC 13528 / IAM 13628 / NBRC 14792 / USDA 110) TaxID=224911 RepID=Q89KH4_BRADU|nr:heavy metal RND transporter [Bradyrhizobium diazoefficiens]QBP23715.1 heavy metal RND transporter [Bradyrhizobium diazoefficiens]BAC50196.1 blr4931 [Bradyrhizobium diazoefficiens USDA 110]
MPQSARMAAYRLATRHVVACDSIRPVEEIEIMTTSHVARAAMAALIATAFATSARAEIKNYEFQLMQPTVKAGADRIVTVRLVNKTSGKTVPDAVVFASRLDMAPDGMQEMATKVTPMPGTEPGTYRFKATFGMAGRWQLSLGAKVQGESGTVENKLVVTAEQ